MNTQDSTSKYRTIHEQPVARVDFDSIWEAKEFVKEYSKVENYPIYGLTDYKYVYMFDEFPGEVQYDPALISVVSLDIETKVGKEDIVTAIQTTPNEVTAITISRDGKKAVFGCKPYTPKDASVTYYHCKDEVDLLKKFLLVWNSEAYSPDVMTGWNVEGFDIPYLVGRINRILGADYMKYLSPWGLVEPYDFEIKGTKITSYRLEGITVLDYLFIYKKFILSPRESYSLDYISKVELDDQKVDYKELGYTGLNDLYERNFELYLDYNIHDVTLVDKLDDKLKLIELVFAAAYSGKINYIDTLGTVLQWDVIIHNHLLEQNIVVNPKPKRVIQQDFVGGYVKETIAGLYKWVVSCDLDGLYPSLIRQYNIGPDTFIRRLSSIPSAEDIIAGVSVPEPEYSVTANGCLFRKDKKSFAAELMQQLRDGRSTDKKNMLVAEEQYEKTKDKKYSSLATRLHSMQHSKKIRANSYYGAQSNPHFRWFDINTAEAITTSGQLSLKWIINKLNVFLNKLCKTENKEFVIAGDTDSTYLNLEDLVNLKFDKDTDDLTITRWLDKFSKEVLEPFIDKSYRELFEQMHAYENHMRMKRENIASTAIFVAQKNYIMNVWNSEGVEYSEPKMKIVGLSAVRSSTPASCRESIKKAIKTIIDTDETTVQNFIADYRSEFESIPLSEIGFPRGINGMIKFTGKGSNLCESGTPVQVRASLVYNKLLKQHNLVGEYDTIGDGEKIKFIYLKTPNPAGENVIGFRDDIPKEFKLHAYIDYETQFQKSFLKPLETILNTIGWSTEKKSTLESFFG